MRKLIFLLIFIISSPFVYSEDTIPHFKNHNNFISTNIPYFLLQNFSLTYERHIFHMLSLEFSFGYFKHFVNSTDNLPIFQESGDEHNFHYTLLYNGMYTRLGLRYYATKHFFISPVFQYTYRFYDNKTIYKIQPDYNGYVIEQYSLSSRCNYTDYIFQVGWSKVYFHRLLMELFIGTGFRHVKYNDKLNYAYTRSSPNGPVNYPIDNFQMNAPIIANRICFIGGYRIGYAF
jgi:hypothetical protein